MAQISLKTHCPLSSASSLNLHTITKTNTTSATHGLVTAQTHDDNSNISTNEQQCIKETTLMTKRWSHATFGKQTVAVAFVILTTVTNLRCDAKRHRQSARCKRSARPNCAYLCRWMRPYGMAKEWKENYFPKDQDAESKNDQTGRNIWAQMNVNGYKWTLCWSVTNVICHYGRSEMHGGGKRCADNNRSSMK
jgi:hypothetical protein